MNAQLVELSSGLRVVLAPCEAESVAFGLFVGSGSRDEDERTAGISHFIEHMLFKGTPKRSALDITQAIEGRGGNFNACTSEESTVYYAHLPYEYLEEAVDILSDMYLHSRFEAQEFERERGVIIEEIKMYEDEPDSVALERLQRSLFPHSQLGAPVAGSAASLSAMTPGDLREYVRSHYLATNTVAVLVGRFDEAEALRLIRTKFRSLSQPRPTARFSRVGSLKGKPVAKVTTTREVQQTQLALGYRTFGIGDERKYAATVVDAILGRGMSSRLFQEVREKRGLSYDISSRMQFFTDAGMWVVTAGLDGNKAEAALKTIDRQLERLATKRVSASELRRIQEFLVGNFRLSHERVNSKLFFYGTTVLAFGKLVDPEEQVRAVRAVTPAQVQAVAAAMFDPAQRAVSWVTPRN